MGFSIPDDLTELILEGERIVWVSRSAFKPFILKNLAGLVVPVVFLLIPIPFMGMFYIPPPHITIFMLPFFILWYCIVGFAVFNFSAYPILLWRNLYYVLTDRRIIVRKGVIGIDYDILDLEYVQQVNLERGIWDRIYGTGTIVVQAIGVKPIAIYSIPDPFKSIEVLKKTVENVKSSKIPRI